MDSTESRYNFYARAFKGGAQTAAVPVQQEQLTNQNQQVQQVQQVPQVAQSQEPQVQQESQTQVTNGELEEEGLNQLNEQVPKTKVDFKITSIIGNLEQTLGSKQKINIDKLFMEQLFGSTY